MNHLVTVAQILKNNEIPLPRTPVDSNAIDSILQLTFSIAGGIALLIIVISGLRFVVANGDPQSVAKAKNTIIYASAGLIVCLLGFAIVTFVLREV